MVAGTREKSGHPLGADRDSVKQNIEHKGNRYTLRRTVCRNSRQTEQRVCGNVERTSAEVIGSDSFQEIEMRTL